MQKSKQLIDLTGRRFGRLTVTGRDTSRNVGCSHWHCVCECGAQRSVNSQKLRNGLTVSCGCHRNEQNRSRIKHGLTVENAHRAELDIFTNMKSRCLNPLDQHFHNYGGRGIKVCNRWLNGCGSMTAFECFVTDMGPRPSSQYSLDRVDNDGDYTPENCRWATPTEQARNRRTYTTVEFRGRQMGIHEACELAGIPYLNVRSRLSKGWSMQRALTQPLRRGYA